MIHSLQAPPQSAQSASPAQSTPSAKQACTGWLQRIGTRYLRATAAALLSAAAWSPAWATLDVKVQANPRPAMPGETLLVSITVSNSDGFDRSGVVLRMPFPVGFASLGFGAIDSGTCNTTVSNNSRCDPTEILTWNLGTVRAGKSVTVTMSPTVEATTLPGASIPLVIDAADSFQGAASSTETITVVNSRVLQLTHIAVTQQPVGPGASVTYQLGFGHTGSSSVATNAVLELPLPSGVGFVSASAGGTFSGDRVIWNLGTLLPGQVGERRVVLTVPGNNSPGSVSKAEAVLTADGGSVVRAALLTRTEAAPGLLLALDINANPAVPGEVLDARLMVSNPGFFDRAGVVTKMRYPVGLESVAFGALDGGACDTHVSNNSRCDPTETLVWNLGTIKAGESKLVSLPPKIAAAALPGSTLAFTSTISDSSGDTASTSESVAVVNSRVLQLGLAEVTQTPVPSGSVLAYQLSFGHTASSTVAANATLELPVPNGLTFMAASDGGVLSGGVVRWSLGTLLPTQVGQRRASFTVAPLAAGSLIKPEAVFVADGDRLVRAGGLTATGANGLLLALDVDSNPATPGEPLRFKLSVSNPSFFDRSGVEARMRFPVGLSSMVNGLVENGACDTHVSNNGNCDSTETVTWNLGTIAAGKSVTVAMPSTVDPSTLPGSVIGFAAAVSDSAGGIARANEAVEVVNRRVLQLTSNEVAQEPALPGAELGYRLSFGHTASSAVAANAVLEVALPEGSGFISASGGGALANRTVRWSLGTLSPGQISTRDLRITSAPLGPVTTGSLGRMEATLSANGGALVQAADTTRLEAEVPLVLDLALSPNPRLPGEALDVTLTVTNSSAFLRSGVLLQMIYPTGLASLSNNLIADGACTTSISNNSACDSLETVVWNLGSLAPGATVTRTFRPSLSPSTVPGSLIEFTSWVQDATARSRNTQVLRVGAGQSCDNAGGDSDGDGICDGGPNPDNCTVVANADQRDTDGDGYGNACDADLDNNGVVNVQDLVRFKQDFGRTGPNLHADFNGDGAVSNTDLVIFKSLFGRPPGPSGLHRAAPVAATSRP